MDKLKQKLVNIEKALGGKHIIPQTDDLLGWHLDYIESLIKEGGGGSSSGTQLYKHMAKLNVVGEDYEPIDIHLMLISWLNTSFEGLHWKELNGKYINAFAIEDRDGEEWITQVITIVNDNDEVQIFIKDQYGNDISYKPNWDGEYTCYIIEDTITEL